MLDQVLELRKKMLQVLKEIKTLCIEERYLESYQLLTTVPGIGLITAITLLTEINSTDRFSDFYKFNSFIGFCPSEYSSGEKEYKGSITPRSHKVLGELIIEAAWISIRQDPALTLCFNEIKKTKGAKRAITCIARKLLNRIYTIWKTKTEYVSGVVK